MIGELEKKGGRGRSAQFIVKKRYCIQTQQVKIFFLPHHKRIYPTPTSSHDLLRSEKLMLFFIRVSRYYC